MDSVDPEDIEHTDGTNNHALTNGTAGGHDDPDAKIPNGSNVINVGDPNQGGGTTSAKKNAVVVLKEKKIPDEKRSTTPYMTKYERARVLGTRALQIRYVDYHCRRSTMSVHDRAFGAVAQETKTVNVGEMSTPGMHGGSKTS